MGKYGSKLNLLIQKNMPDFVFLSLSDRQIKFVSFWAFGELRFFAAAVAASTVDYSLTYDDDW